jgi:type IX secretion system PorP/SprF family membrane protein
MLLFSVASKAQQFPIYNFQFLNQSIYNPAGIGIGDQVNTMLLNKTYLEGLSGRPTTFYATIDGPIVSDKFGVGLSLINENLGITNKLGVYGMGSYRLLFSTNHHLSFGLSAGLLQVSINEDEIDVSDTQDPLLVNKNFNSSAIDGTFGVKYQNKNLEIGLGINQLLGNKSQITDNVSFNLSRGIIGSAKYRLFLNSKKDFSLEPMIVARYSEVEMPQEAFLLINWKDLLVLAPSYKSTGAVGVSFLLKNYKGFSIGYSFETITNKEISSVESGSHEIMAGYSFDIRSKSNKKINNQLQDLEDELENNKKRQDKINNQLQDLEDALENNKKIQNQKDSLQDKSIKKNNEELKRLKEDLKKAGVLRDGKLENYKEAKQGYYLVIASVKKENVDRNRLKSDYTDKSYETLESDKSDWIYVYQNFTTDFSSALAKLKKARSGENPKAWIYVLK